MSRQMQPKRHSAKGMFGNAAKTTLCTRNVMAGAAKATQCTRDVWQMQPKPHSAQKWHGKCSQNDTVHKELYGFQHAETFIYGQSLKHLGTSKLPLSLGAKERATRASKAHPHASPSCQRPWQAAASPPELHASTPPAPQASSTPDHSAAAVASCCWTLIHCYHLYFCHYCYCCFCWDQWVREVARCVQEAAAARWCVGRTSTSAGLGAQEYRQKSWAGTCVCEDLGLRHLHEAQGAGKSRCTQAHGSGHARACYQCSRAAHQEIPVRRWLCRCLLGCCCSCFLPHCLLPLLPVLPLQQC
mmetsp:Transcript_15428/g.40686  ORF Transcript_15428/g.40686 Transcript_15428/m.40686 type:complete len:300 (+) Transcript_15428:498-1397(+)